MRRTHSIAVVLIVTSCILFGCRPRGILHSWEMRDVLVDLHKTDALLQVSGLQYGNDEVRGIYYAQVMEKHGITQAQFDSSLVWYTAHPQLFDKIYPKVLQDLKEEQEAFIALHGDGMDILSPGTESAEPACAFTQAQLDSMVHVTLFGLPNIWTPEQLVHDTIDQFLPQIPLLR